jgi:ABC-2 type transport system permease protein
MEQNAGRLWIVFSQYFKNYYRSRSFYMMLFVSLMVSTIMTYFSLRYGSNIQVRFDGFTFNSLSSQLKENIMLYIWGIILSYLPVFSSVFFGSPAISSEIENGTAYHIFPLPIKRTTLLAGKLISAILVSFIVVSIYSLFELVNLEIMFGNVPWILFLYSYLLLLLFIVSITSFTFLVSAIFNKNLYAYITVFLLYYLIFNAVYIILEFLYNYNAYFLLNQAATIIERVFVNLNFLFPLSNSTINGASVGEMYSAAVVMFLYTVISVAGALVLFDRKEVR